MAEKDFVFHKHPNYPPIKYSQKNLAQDGKRARQRAQRLHLSLFPADSNNPLYVSRAGSPNFAPHESEASEQPNKRENSSGSHTTQIIGKAKKKLRRRRAGKTLEEKKLSKQNRRQSAHHYSAVSEDTLELSEWRIVSPGLQERFDTEGI